MSETSTPADIPAVAHTAARVTTDTAGAELLRGLADGSPSEIEVAWSDPFGHAAGKRIPAAEFLDRARGMSFAFREATLGWNTAAAVIDGLRPTNWNGGHPDVHAIQPRFASSAT